MCKLYTDLVIIMLMLSYCHSNTILIKLIYFLLKVPGWGTKSVVLAVIAESSPSLRFPSTETAALTRNW